MLSHHSANKRRWHGSPRPLEAEEHDAVPVEDYTQFRERVHMEYGVVLTFTPEPDGSFSWAVLSETGEPLQQGIADDWDGAKLAAIENLMPSPS